MRNHINLLEYFQIHYDIDAVIGTIYNDLDWSGGDGEHLKELFGHDDIDDVDISSDEFNREFALFFEDRIGDAEASIGDRFRNNKLPVFRVITAPLDWKPDLNMHPGIYWSWDEKSAQAHWGSYQNGDVEWMLRGHVDHDDINWVTTLAMNASLSYADEREIRLNEGVWVEYTLTKKA